MIARWSRLFVLLTLTFIVSILVAEETSSYVESPITSEEREHWSFRPLQRPAVPSVNGEWCRNPIDRFVWDKWETKGLRPQPPASRRTLARRLYFGLTGLPPTPAELDAIVFDPAPDAVERLVDSLLASPRYGEHWGQFWLDLARFAETDGYEHDLIRQEAWRYRDWVVSALNADMPYGQFVISQLAGDERIPKDAAARVPTGFCVAGPDMPDLNSQEERRHQLLNELTSTVGSALLGLQFGCAQCHDHKYDPVSMGDFYRLRAVFEPAVQVTKNRSITFLEANPSAGAVSRVWLRGDWRRPGPVVEPEFPRILQAVNREPDRAGRLAAKVAPRLAFAEGLVRADHPLTWRVIANRLWQFHFGVGLCRTPSDVGLVGDSPSHPELLDWLAAELAACDGSWKQFHRLVVTSAVYQQASRPTEEEWDAATRGAANENWMKSVHEDPANLYLSRFPRQRLRGEALRDAMLAISGELVEVSGGPGVMPPLPGEVVKMLLKDQWKVSPSLADHHRRSIYVFARRNLRYPLFEAFDRPDANASCPERPRSTTAPQSLMLLNSEITWQLARQLAERVGCEAGVDEGSRVTLAARLVWGRNPFPEEEAAMTQFLRAQAAPLPTAGDQAGSVALVDLCQALWNTSEFLYVD